MTKHKKEDWYADDEPEKETPKHGKEPDSTLAVKDSPAVDPVVPNPVPPPYPESKELTALKAQVEKTQLAEADAHTTLVKTAEEICQNKAKPEKVLSLAVRIEKINTALAGQTAAIAATEDALKKAAEALTQSFTS